jgi:DNA modification methylase
MKTNQIYHGDCLDLLPSIPSKSVDMILCDLPYGTTYCSWDSVLPLDRLWQQYERVIKDNGAIVLTANGQFIFTLYNSNPKLFKYDWIWEKSISSGFLNAQTHPLRKQEMILVFYKKLPLYNAQLTKERDESFKYVKSQIVHKGVYRERNYYQRGQDIGYPKSILKIDNPNTKSIHPTQKPVALFEYLIKTYTNENELVLDNCSGSGTTAIACLNSNRQYICIEKDEAYYKKSLERVANHEPLLNLQNINEN